MDLYSGMTYCLKTTSKVSFDRVFTEKLYCFAFFRYHPHFKNVMQSRISQLMGVDYKFDLMLSEDGSGRGAALVAAVLKRNEDKGQQNGGGGSA